MLSPLSGKRRFKPNSRRKRENLYAAFNHFPES